MEHTYWHKQTREQPLFADLLWSRPENSAQAGKLLIVGGNAHSFAAAAEAYTAATQAGVGSTRVLLPDSLQKTVGKVFAAGEYAASTPSGSFGQKALSDLLDLSEWSDGVLLAGDFGRNSETAILLEKFANKYSGQLTITHDGIDYFSKAPDVLLSHSQCLLTLSFAQLQKLAISLKFTTAFRFEMDFLQIIEALHNFSLKFKLAIVVKHLESTFVAYDGQVSTTKIVDDQEVWRVKTASKAAVWFLQNPGRLFEAVSTSLIA